MQESPERFFPQTAPQLKAFRSKKALNWPNPHERVAVWRPQKHMTSVISGHSEHGPAWQILEHECVPQLRSLEQGEPQDRELLLARVLLQRTTCSSAPQKQRDLIIAEHGGHGPG
jgi:hypothetical protein